jgi:hypothetical protein
VPPAPSCDRTERTETGDHQRSRQGQRRDQGVIARFNSVMAKLLNSINTNIVGITNYTSIYIKIVGYSLN